MEQGKNQKEVCIDNLVKKVRTLYFEKERNVQYSHGVIDLQGHIHPGKFDAYVVKTHSDSRTLREGMDELNLINKIYGDKVFSLFLYTSHENEVLAYEPSIEGLFAMFKDKTGFEHYKECLRSLSAQHYESSLREHYIK